MQNRLTRFLFVTLSAWFLTGAIACKEHCEDAWRNYFARIKSDGSGALLYRFQTDFLAYAAERPAKDWAPSVQPFYNETIRSQIALGFMKKAVSASESMLKLIDKTEPSADDKRSLELAASDIRRHVGYPLTILGRMDEAIRYLSIELRTIGMNQEGPRFWVLINLGNALMNQGKYDEAFSTFGDAERILTTHTDEKEFAELRAWSQLFWSYFYHSKGDLGKAYEATELAARLTDSSHGADARAYTLLSKASLLRRKGKYAESLKAVRDATAAIKASNPFMFDFERLATYAAMGNTVEAGKIHNKLMSSRADYKIVFGPLVEFYLAKAKGDTRGAKLHLENARKKLGANNIELQDAVSSMK